MPKRNGLGRAFERAITTREEEEREHVRTGGKVEFINKNRREIFEYLCLHPCTKASQISKAVGLTYHSSIWHLKKLIGTGFIKRYSVAKKNVYYPKDLIPIEDVPLLMLLNTDKARMIMLTILEKGGISQGEVCRLLSFKHQAVIWYTRKLEKHGLITSLEDGRYRRYYSTDLLQKKTDDCSNRIKNFRKNILRKLKKNGLSPTIIRSPDEKIVVRISSGKHKAVLTLHTNPYYTSLL
jgi:predicted transcriptional regulator